MPTEEEKKNEKMVDIDTTGPGAAIEVTEEKTPDQEVEVKHEEVKQDDTKPADTSEKSDEQPVVQDSKPEKQDEKLEEYSDTVNKRIAKLTKKWREAERQKDAAIDYAKGVEHKRKQWETRYAKLDSTYLKDSETRVKSKLD